MPLTRRYRPEHPAGDKSAFAYDFSTVIPWGMVLVSGSVAVFKNTNPPVDASADWAVLPVQTSGRMLWAILTGGVTGIDYLLQWTGTDSRGNVWVRNAAVLCAPTS